VTAALTTVTAAAWAAVPPAVVFTTEACRFCRRGPGPAGAHGGGPSRNVSQRGRQPGQPRALRAELAAATRIKTVPCGLCCGPPGGGRTGPQRGLAPASSPAAVLSVSVLCCGHFVTMPLCNRVICVIAPPRQRLTVSLCHWCPCRCPFQAQSSGTLSQAPVLPPRPCPAPLRPRQKRQATSSTGTAHGAAPRLLGGPTPAHWGGQSPEEAERALAVYRRMADPSTGVPRGDHWVREGSPGRGCSRPGGPSVFDGAAGVEVDAGQRA